MGRDGAGSRRRARRRAWTTVVTTAFTHDVEEQVAWLVGQDREEWAHGLKRALRTARVLLERNPELVRADEHGFRRQLLGRIPLFIWFLANEETREVVWLRLFHVRQSSARRGK